MKTIGVLWTKVAGYVFLGVLAVGFLAVCKGKQAEESKPIAQQEAYTLDALKTVLGEAKDDASGIVDVTGDAQELVLSYRYYDDDAQNYDDDMVKDLAPKIEDLYRKFKGLDRVVFQITTNNPQAPGEWKPFANFALDRKTVEKVAWSGILAQDFFQKVFELKRFD
jgi:hypothetical protein